MNRSLLNVSLFYPCALVAATLLGSCQLAKSSVPAPRRIQVLIIDEAGIPGPELRAMKLYDRSIFERAHIAIEWIDEVASLAVRGWGDQLVMIVRIGSGHKSDVRFVGTAYVDEDGGQNATLNFDLVKQLAFIGPARCGQILAAAAAHEIGHLLLGPGSHSPHGVMRPRLGRRELLTAFRMPCGHQGSSEISIQCLRTIWTGWRC